MEFKNYESGSTIPDKHLQSVVEAEIECWGSAPFDEYSICSDDKCGKLYSIEEVHGSLAKYREGLNKIIHNCECGVETVDYYDIEGFLSEIKEYIKGNVSSVLLLVDDEVEGFGIISKTTIGNLLEVEFNTRPKSFNKYEVGKKLSEYLYGVENALEKEVIVLHQIFVSEDYRNGTTGFDILKQVVSSNPDYCGIPVVGETRFEGDFYPISRSIGFENIEVDSHGYVIQALKDYEDLYNFVLENNSFLSKGLLKSLLKFKRESKRILDSNPSFKERKSYIFNN